MRIFAGIGLFETTHYNLIDGTPGSGKGATLITFQLLGYRVILAADLYGNSVSINISSCSILQLQPVPMPGSKRALRTGCRYTRRVRSSSLSNRISTGL